jgi:molybdopterin synthase catalytic subunit
MAADGRRFALTEATIPSSAPFALTIDIGALVTFDGIVRDHNEGQSVVRLEYSAYAALAESEGSRIVEEAIARFGLANAACIHRTGTLVPGEIAVRVWAASAHRGEAFAGCAHIIDAIKHRVPIWKKETYASGEQSWVRCDHRSPSQD